MSHSEVPASSSSMPGLALGSDTNLYSLLAQLSSKYSSQLPPLTGFSPSLVTSFCPTMNPSITWCYPSCRRLTGAALLNTAAPDYDTSPQCPTHQHALHSDTRPAFLPQSISEGVDHSASNTHHKTPFLYEERLASTAAAARLCKLLEDSLGQTPSASQRPGLIKAFPSQSGSACPAQTSSSFSPSSSPQHASLPQLARAPQQRRRLTWWRG